MPLPTAEQMDPVIPEIFRTQAHAIWEASDFNDAIIARTSPRLVTPDMEAASLLQMNMIGALLSKNLPLVEKCRQDYIEATKKRMLPHHADKDEPAYWNMLANDFIEHAQGGIQLSVPGFAYP